MRGQFRLPIAVLLNMFTGRKKIVKPAGQQPDQFESLVAQELFNLEVCVR